MSHLKKMLFLFIGLCVFWGHSSFAIDEELDSISTLLEVEEDDLYIIYGEYAEIEINSKKDIQLELENNVRPYGFELEKTGNKSYVLFGRSEFVGKLCFLINAQKPNGKISKERLCLYSQDNDEISYPQVEQSRFLKPVELYNELNIDFSISEHDERIIQTVVSDLPSWVRQGNNADGSLYLSGKSDSVGVIEIVVKTKESYSSVVVYHQFILEVVNNLSNDNDNQYQCAPGYYWDGYLKYCVQAAGRSCGIGTWYDVESNSCIAYRQIDQCRYGQYFDHWLNRCVRNEAMRCPINYEWDKFYGTCVRLPYTCSYSERYDFSLRRCLPIYSTRSCSIGYHWNIFRLRCEMNYGFCHPGNYWNGSYCERTTRFCNIGNYYDPNRGRCISRNIVRSCRVGEYWDHGRAACLGRRVVDSRNCSYGSRWSSSYRMCVRFEPGRQSRYENRPHRRLEEPRTRPGSRPDMRPGTQPGSRPDMRPGTRPGSRPDMRPGTRPGSRPDMRPGTRPEPSRPAPSRPTTRPEPSRPAPSRPTTRPEPSRPAPSRPTTRPEPSRPAPSRPIPPRSGDSRGRSERRGDMNERSR